jgi:hypothetical protein
MPNRSLTDEQHVCQGGRFCPVCLHRIIKYGDIHHSGAVFLQRASCATCGAKWEDKYDLMGYINLEAPPLPPQGITSHIHCTAVITASDGHESLVPVDFLVLHEYGRLTEDPILRYARDIVGFVRIHEITRVEVLS